MKTWKYLFLLLLAIQPLVIIGAFICGQRSGFDRAQIDWNEPPEWLQYPTIQQAQAWFGCEKVDGWLCEGLDAVGHSETRDKWTEKTGNQMFDKYYTLSGAPAPEN